MSECQFGENLDALSSPEGRFLLVAWREKPKARATRERHFKLRTSGSGDKNDLDSSFAHTLYV